MKLIQIVPPPPVARFDPPEPRAVAASAREAALQFKVFIASDVKLHRDGLASLLRGYPSIQLLGSDNLRASLVALRTVTTDVALLDALQPGDSCLVDSLRQIRPRPRILALGVREDAADVLSCAAAGIDGYIRIDAEVGDMLAAIEAVVRGSSVCSRGIAAASPYHCFDASSRTPPAAPLTTRELQVADLMNRGFPNKQIARYLGVELCTAKNHVRNILQKLHVHYRGQAAAKLRSLIGSGP